MRIQFVKIIAGVVGCVLGSVASCGVLEAASPAALQSHLQQVVEGAQQASNSPGVVAALFDRDSISTAAAGVRRAGGQDAMSSNDTVFLGSTFKSITATMVAMYVDRGLLSWDTALSDVYPENTLDAGYRDVTIRQILAHRSGLGDDVEYLFDDPFEGTPRAERDHFIPQILARPPQNEVGTFSYSNIGYTTAGAILERVAQKSFDAIVHEELVEGLGISSLTFGPPEGVAGHDEAGQPATLEQQELAAVIGPAGLYSMNLADWARVARVQCAGDDRISNEARSMLHEPVGDAVNIGSVASYALGWGIVEAGDTSLLTHNGSNSFWLASILMNPDTCRGVLFTANQENAGELALEALASDSRILQYVAAVPEPSGAGPLAAGGVLLTIGLRRRKNGAFATKLEY